MNYLCEKRKAYIYICVCAFRTKKQCIKDNLNGGGQYYLYCSLCSIY